MEDILEVKSINTYYGHSHVLNDMSFSMPAGRVIAILGRNGAGKTTTLRSIMGLTPPRQGEIRFLGKPIHKLPAYQISNMGMGYVPQGRKLFKSLTVEEHLTVYWNKKQTGNNGWSPERALEVFPRLKERLQNKGNELSGGEQQMLAIARALMIGPKMLLMDEPTEGLAPMIVDEVGQLIRVVKEAGLSILLTEQKMMFALELADEVYVISRGQVVCHCSPEELLSDEETKNMYLGV